MQQQQQGGGGSQYGAPPSEMPPFSPSGVGSRPHLLGIPGSDPLQQPPAAAMPEVASPINSRPPGARAMDFDELTPAVSGSFPDDEALAAGEDAERAGGTSGNRWPRQETLALLKIRSEMDAAFRDATLKGPLWEEVSRKLAELGYKRSSKKCKEKFENVHKYYKRTKEGRAGRQDGKSYRFFTQLEALYSGGAGAGAVPISTADPGAAPSTAPSTTFTAGVAVPPASRAQPITAVAPPTMAMPTRVVVPELTNPVGPQGISSSAAAAAAAGLIFSSNSSSYSSASDTDDEETEEAGESQEGRKRKRSGVESSGTSRKMMTFFDRLMRQVMERQEAMQQRFLEVIEKREQDRMIRDEAWRRQEMGRLSREQELLAHERAMAASRDAAIISYLQKISGQPITIPVPTTLPATFTSISPIPPPPAAAATQQLTPQQTKAPALPQPPAQHHQSGESSSSMAAELVPFLDSQEGAGGGGSLEPLASPSRWPKAEVHALINLRSGLDSKYQDSGPKGTLWEEISAGMQRLGYNRSAKRCKEKWENINKYFKKVKESNKKRPEDSKTCPYFHQLDALYRSKQTQRQQIQETNEQQQAPLPPSPLPPSAPPQPGAEPESKNGTSGSTSNGNGGNSDNAQVTTSNGGLPPSLLDEGAKKPEDIVKELMGQHQQQAPRADDYDNEADSSEQEDGDNDEEDNDEDGKLQYKIQFQRQNLSAGGGGNGSAPAASSFLAIVQ